MFSEPLAKIKNETKIKTSLKTMGPPGVPGALCSVRILHIGRIGSANSHSGEKSLRELDLNIHLYLTLNCGTASEHL